MFLKTEKLLKVFLKRATPLQFAFCISKSQFCPLLKVKREKAKLACELIDFIGSEPVNQASIKQSLQENILQVIKAKSDLKPESRKYFEQFFINGVQIDGRIFHQDRLRHAENPQSKRLVFYPTYMVTGQIFRNLMNISQGTSMLVGRPGISKTTSVCLFYYLTKIIDEYRFSQGVEVDEKMKRIPKVVYWSIIMSQNKLETIKELILQQCPEINNQKYMKDAFSFQNFQKLFKYYRKLFPRTQLILIVDQVDNLKQQQREVVEESKKPACQLSSHQKNQLEQSSKQIISTFKSIQNLLLHFTTVIYLSAMGLEDKKPRFVQFTSSYNQPLPQMIRIQYSNNFYEPRTLMELVNYFLFEVEQRIISQIQHKQVYHKTKQALRSQCYTYLENKMPEFFITPLDFRSCIQQFVKDQPKFQQFKKFRVQEDSFKILLFKQFRQKVDITKERYINLLKNHFQKIDDKKIRKKLMFQLYQECFLSIKYRLILGQDYQNRLYKDRIIIKNLSCSKEQISQLVDQKLFDMNDRYSNYLDLLVPIQFLQMFLEQHVCQNVVNYLRNIKNYLNGSYNFQQLENLAKNFINLIIKNGYYTRVVLSLGKSIMSEGSYNIQFEFLSQNIFGFKALPNAERKQISFISQFKDNIDEMIRTRKTCAAFFPLKKDSLQQTRQIEINKMIDFIWIKTNVTNLHSIGGFIHIWIFGVTMSTTEVQKKVLDFLKEFQKFSDRHQTSYKYQKHEYQIKINYIVLGSQSGVFDRQKFIDKLNQNKSNLGLKLDLNQNTSLAKSILQVKSLKNKKCLLNMFGYVNMGWDLLFERKEGDQVTNCQFGRALDQLNNRRQALQLQAQLNKYRSS